MTTTPYIVTAKIIRIAEVANGEMRPNYRVGGGLLGGPRETLEDLMGYCIDAPDDLPAGGILSTFCCTTDCVPRIVARPNGDWR